MNLFVWNTFAEDEVIQSLYMLKKGKNQEDMRAMNALLGFAVETATTTDIIREYVIRTLIRTATTLAVLCQETPQNMGTLYQFAKQDIETIYDEWMAFDWEKQNTTLQWFENFQKQKTTLVRAYGFEESIQMMVNAKNNDELLNLLCQHIHTFGTNTEGEFIAFRWKNNELIPIKEVDSQAMDELIGIDYQKEILIENTRAFLEGKRANHILLCGAMGSGKSSCVKALLPYFSKERLRLVEVGRLDLLTLNGLLDKIEKESNECKYIVFLDDLSFENDDVAYSYLKTALDGQLLKTNDRVIYYATSNRRNLVKDNWNDRTGDVHEEDTMNEKYSLAERFGIKLFFPVYDQSEYLAIVKAYLNNENIEYTIDIEKEALLWERMYHGRSGRTAVNFVHYYLGKVN